MLVRPYLMNSGAYNFFKQVYCIEEFRCSLRKGQVGVMVRFSVVPNP